MWIVRDNRRDAKLWPAHWWEEGSRLRGLTTVSGGGVALLAGLTVPGASGKFVYDPFTRGRVDWRRSEDGLYEAGLLMDETDAVRR